MTEEGYLCVVEIGHILCENFLLSTKSTQNEYSFKMAALTVSTGLVNGIRWQAETMFILNQYSEVVTPIIFQ